jgi:steroid 5-alpha reductase family enzyme
MTLLIQAGLGAAVVTAVMLMTFLIGRRLHNFSFVDIAWSANFAVLAVLYGLVGDGLPARRALICAMTAAWSIRLAWHLGRRVIGHPEEGRYVDLRQRWGAAGPAAFERRMLRFYLIQAALDVVLAWPLLLVTNNLAASFSALEWTGAGLWAAALVGESLADWQLARFKSDPAAQGQVCDRGLWSWSRHPNYFFEWLVWVAYALMAIAVPGALAWTSLLMPALMLYFLLKVTGIPATEAQTLRSKGAAYAAYQARTSPFIPLPPRRKPL